MVIKDKRVQQEIKVPLTELFHCVVWVIFFRRRSAYIIFYIFVFINAQLVSFKFGNNILYAYKWQLQL